MLNQSLIHSGLKTLKNYIYLFHITQIYLMFLSIWGKLNTKFPFFFYVCISFVWQTFLKTKRGFVQSNCKSRKLPRFVNLNSEFDHGIWFFNILFFWPKTLGWALKRYLMPMAYYYAHGLLLYNRPCDALVNITLFFFIKLTRLFSSSLMVSL